MKLEDQVYITIKDEDGVLLPLAYLETKERHAIGKRPTLEDWDTFVEVVLVEVHK